MQFDQEIFDKNVKYLTTMDFTKDWFFTAYPDLKDRDFREWSSTSVCDVCAVKFSTTIRKKADIVKSRLVGVLCDNCMTIIQSMHDIEHCSQILQYMKEKA